MPRTLQLETTVLPGHRIEICSPDLPEGRVAIVSITIDDAPMPKRSFSEVLGDYKGGGLFKTAEEVDDYIRRERDAWDR